MADDYSVDIAQALKDYLDDDDWHYSFDADRGLFRFGLNLKGKMKNIQYVVSVRENDYSVYAISPLSADQDDKKQMRRMAEFVCRANYGLRDGNFELDFNDGELRYKCYVNCNGIQPTEEMISRSIHCPAAMFTRYGDGIVQILFNDMSAKAAVEMCESSLRFPFSRDDGEEDSRPSVSPEETSRFLDLLRRMQEDLESETSDDE